MSLPLSMLALSAICNNGVESIGFICALSWEMKYSLISVSTLDGRAGLLEANGQSLAGIGP